MNVKVAMIGLPLIAWAFLASNHLSHAERDEEEHSQDKNSGGGSLLRLSSTDSQEPKPQNFDREFGESLSEIKEHTQEERRLAEVQSNVSEGRKSDFKLCD